MASITYSGSFNGSPGYAGATATVNGTPLPSDAVITGVSYELRVKATHFDSSYDWILGEISVGGAGGSITASGNDSMSNSDHTFRGTMAFNSSDASQFEDGSFSVYAQAYSTYSNASTYLWEFSITVEYANPENCVEPSEVTVDGSTDSIYVTGETVTLEWSGAQAGTGNSIRGYQIFSYDSKDGGDTWVDFQIVAIIETTETSGNTVVPSPAVGTRRKFVIYTLSVYGATYDSLEAAESPVVIGGHPQLEGFTEPVLVPGESFIRALHMQELQDRVTTLRSYYGLSDYNFTKITAGVTSLAGWMGHVMELRAAIDEIGLAHETWLAITQNQPRADVIMQLRSVLLSDSSEPVEPPTENTTAALDTAVLDTMQLA